MRAAAWVVGVKRVRDRSESSGLGDRSERVRGGVRGRSGRVRLREMFRERERESYYFNLLK